MRIKIRPVRWWRDDATRFVSRDERRHFNLSEVPRGDNPELDAFVENWRDTIGFFPIAPLQFEQLDPMPGADPFVSMRYPPPPLRMTGCFFDLDDI